MVIEAILLVSLAAILGAIYGLWFSDNVAFSGARSRALRQAPLPIWTERAGQVDWANTRCRDVFGNSFGGSRTLERRPVSGTSGVEVVEAAGTDGQASYFTLLEHQNDASTTVFALDANPLKECEEELQRFVQTLTMTFAHLPIGLAVFDRKRDLTLFNPALSHLLSLPPDWLARRPSLSAFLDRLRNDGALPEPKDYSTLKEEFKALESGAFDGTYEVEWTLPNGRLHRVTGRPHAQGGAALLFEDITHSAAIEAQYQAEMRQLHGALEALTDAVVIFDAAGELAYANDAFDDMWQCTLSRSVTPVSVTEVSKLFQSRCRPDPTFGDMRSFVLDLRERSEWESEVEMTTGARIRLRFTPISEGRVICEQRLLEDVDGRDRPSQVVRMADHREGRTG